MGKPEAAVEAYLITRVKALGGEIRKAMWIGRRGAPDRFVMLLPTYCARQYWWQGRNPWVECKALGEDLKDHQLREIERMRRFGETVLVLDSREAVDAAFPPP
ncbi:hypothetical protein JessAGP_027 [Caulobacter phage Jess A]|nr:hypothetical protein JessAGP_027 [Caulobacter phage Jess A]QNH91679.1 hypothetical protein SR18_gp028 [Caulobacter phage SR18]WCA46436.1 hypothetical protein [Caulobacter phage RapA]